MKLSIEKGQAIILVGPQGCGKDLLAHALATSHGSFCETEAWMLDEEGFSHVLEAAASTVIVYGFPRNPETCVSLNLMITGSPVRVRGENGQMKSAPAPNFIFCVDDVSPVNAGDRRFNVVSVSGFSRAGADFEWIFSRAGEEATTPTGSATETLHAAAAHIQHRAQIRDQPDGERSMARTVAAFNALTGHTLSEFEGWMFMATLNAARACGGSPKQDDFEDGAAYIALAGECAHKGDG